MLSAILNSHFVSVVCLINHHNWIIHTSYLDIKRVNGYFRHRRMIVVAVVLLRQGLIPIEQNTDRNADTGIWKNLQ